jgi:hypothetical protein
MAEPPAVQSRPELPLIDERQLELFKQFVSVQQNQIDLKAKEIALREKELTVEDGNFQRSHEYAIKALDAQSRDRDAKRVLSKTVIKWSFLFGGALVVLFAIFSGFALYLGKIEMVKDIVLQVFGTGGIGAAMFFAARSFYKNQTKPENDTEE